MAAVPAGPPSFGPAIKTTSPNVASAPPAAAVMKGGSKRPPELRGGAAACGAGGTTAGEMGVRKAPAQSQDYVDEFRRLREREAEIKDLAGRLGDLLGGDEDSVDAAMEEESLISAPCAEASSTAGTAAPDIDEELAAALGRQLTPRGGDEARAEQAEREAEALRREMHANAVQAEEERRGLLERWNRDIERLEAAQASELHALQQAQQLGQCLQARDAEILELRARLAAGVREPSGASTLDMQLAAQQSELQALQHCQQLAQQLARRDAELADLRRELSRHELLTCPACAARAAVAAQVAQAEGAPPVTQKEIWLPPPPCADAAPAATPSDEDCSESRTSAPTAVPTPPAMASDAPAQADPGVQSDRIAVQQAHVCTVSDLDEPVTAAPSPDASMPRTATVTPSLGGMVASLTPPRSIPDVDISVSSAAPVTPRTVQPMITSKVAGKSPGTDTGIRPLLPFASGRPEAAVNAGEPRTKSPVVRRPASPSDRRLASPMQGTRPVRAMVLPSVAPEVLERRPPSPVQRHKSTQSMLLLPGAHQAPQQSPGASAPPQLSSPQGSARTTMPLSFPFASSPVVVVRGVSRSRSSPQKPAGRDLQHMAESQCSARLQR